MTELIEFHLLNCIMISFATCCMLIDKRDCLVKYVMNTWINSMELS